MIYEIDKNLLEAELDGIIHSCNCFHTMGGGIAYRIKVKYPEAYEADWKTPYGEYAKLGTFSVAILPSNFHIYNLYGQFSFGAGKQTSYDAVDSGLRYIEIHARENGLKTLGLPKNMGCVLGGGDFRVVRAIIECVFCISPIDLYICNYNG